MNRQRCLGLLLLTAVLTAAGASAFAAVAAVRADASNPAVQPPTRVVRVTAERFQFTPSEVKVPHGTTIEFHLTSDDTAHGFRIIGQAIDVALPKRGRGEATVTFTPPEPGSYVFECSRMCGAGHSFMRGVIRVTPASSATP
jgi:cytochrome c oxidase subunit 2